MLYNKVKEQNMKKYIIIALLIATNVLTIQAQSSMTDDQIISFVLKEQEAGTSQQQIVTKLMQRVWTCHVCDR